MFAPEAARRALRGLWGPRALLWLAAFTGVVTACSDRPAKDGPGDGDADADADADVDADGDADAGVGVDAGFDAGPPRPVGFQDFERAGAGCWTAHDLVFFTEEDITATLVLGESGEPHVVNCGVVPGDFGARSFLKHFTPDVAGTWMMEDVRIEEFERHDIGALAFPRAAMDPDGLLHVVFGQYREIRQGEEADAGAQLWHGVRDMAGQWSFEEVPTPEYNADSQLAIGADGVVYVLTRELRVRAETESLHLARKVPGEAWTTEEVVDNAEFRRSPGLAVDANGAAHVIFHERCPQERLKACEPARSARVGLLRYGTNASGAWVFETIDDMTLESSAAIALDSTGGVHIAYPRLRDIGYASNATGNWVREGLLSNELQYLWVSLAIDAQDRAHVAVAGPQRLESQFLMYATNRAFRWDTEEIDANAPRDGHPVIAVGADGTPWVTSLGSGTIEDFHEVYTSVATRCAYDDIDTR